jgi:hypothetical protein
MRIWAALSMVGFLSFLGATWNWFDADEFVNLEQALRSAHGERLYVSTPSNHPPLYTEIFLRPLLSLPGPDLLVARLVSVLCVWGAGLILADAFRRHRGVGAARLFLVLWTLNGFALTVGTRAMNEVPMLLLLAYALHVILGRRTVAMAGAAAAAAVLVRFTSVFYLPALLPRDRGRALRMMVVGAACTVAVLAPLFVAGPGTFQGFVRWAIRFHAERASEDWLRRIGKTVWWTGVVFLAPFAKALGLAKRPLDRPVASGLAAIASAGLMVFLPSVHVHYFLPCALVVTGAATVLLEGAWTARSSVIGAAFLLVTASQGAFYVPMTPHHDLDRAQRVADWIDAHTPTGAPILTDAPQYAVLAHRDNWHGYFWSLRTEFSAQELRSALNETSLVVVSQRFGHYDRGFPQQFLETLDGVPCRAIEDAHLYWTGTSGAAPERFAQGC